jgi:hypothetical protein
VADAASVFRDSQRKASTILEVVAVLAVAVVMVRMYYVLWNVWLVAVAAERFRAEPATKDRNGSGSEPA